MSKFAKVINDKVPKHFDKEYPVLKIDGCIVTLEIGTAKCAFLNTELEIREQETTAEAEPPVSSDPDPKS